MQKLPVPADKLPVSNISPIGPSPKFGFDVIAWSILLSLGAFLGWMSWQGWGNPIIDFGREVYVPWQIRTGRVLYQDLIYNYGPLAPYVMAGVTAALGDTLAVYAGAGATIGAGTMAGLYVSGCRLGSPSAGFIAALLFVLHSFFGYSTWGSNYVLPYSYAATLSMLFAVWSFCGLLGYLYRGRRQKDLWLGAACLIAALLTKLEVGIAIAGTWALAAWAHRVGWRTVASVAIAVSGFIVVVIGMFAYLAGLRALLLDNLFRFASPNQSAWSLFREMASLDEFRFSPFDLTAYRATLPLALCILFWRPRREPVWLLAAVTALCAPRILLAFEPTWYGFYLFVPGYLLLGYVGAAWLSRWRAVAAAATILALVIAVRFNQATFDEYRKKTDVIHTQKGLMRDTHSGRATAIEAFIGYMAQHATPTDTLVVLPEGATLNWWTGLPNPTRYYSYIPPELTGPDVELRMAEEIAATQPTYVVVTSRPLLEFGVRDVGYLPNVLRHLAARYEVTRSFGPPAETAWRIVLLTKKR